MKTLVRTLAESISVTTDGAYAQDLRVAVVAATALVAIVIITWLVIRAVHATVRILLDAARLASISAGLVTTAMIAFVVVIGLTHR